MAMDIGDTRGSEEETHRETGAETHRETGADMMSPSTETPVPMAVGTGDTRGSGYHTEKWIRSHVQRSITSTNLQYHFDNLDFTYTHTTRLSQTKTSPSTGPTIFEYQIVMNDADLMERARQQRQNSKTILHKMTNVTFYIHKIKDHPIGAPYPLLDHIVKSKSIISLLGDRHGSYTDKLCFSGVLLSITTTKDLFREYLTWAGKTAKQFKGVSLKHLNDMEALFDVDIYVYALQPNDDEDAAADDFFAELIRRPLSTHDNTMYLNLCGVHFSYIKDFKAYAKSFACPQCGKRWNHRGNCEVHIRTCDGKAAREYPGGAYHLKHTIFEKLQDEGIVLAEEDHFYPYRACFDIECLLKPLNDPQTTMGDRPRAPER
ncbi:hypothetical protein Bbelb_186990 [Branchiostoma belcheri]|nr:hypothetical protein Bbelb_186990 [Branchiostoma belcheri]